MDAQEFRAWATDRGVDDATISQLIVFAHTPEELDEDEEEEMEPPPLVYELGDIRKLHDGNEMRIAPEEAGFMIIGGCPDGDPIAIDIGDDMGSVWYFDHEVMERGSLRSVAVRVANDVSELIKRYGNDKEFPYDYYDAKYYRKKD